MKIQASVVAVLSLLAANILPAGTSPRFKVDTRDRKFCIQSFDSDFCSGQYGSRNGKRAYFPANFNGNLDVVFTVEAEEDVVGFIYSDSPMTSTEKTHRVSLRNKPAGYSLTVVGVDRDGRKTAPFRANFDMVRICFAPALTKADRNNGVLTCSGSAEFSGKEVGGKPTVALPNVDNSSANAKMGLVPKVVLSYEFNSDGTAEVAAGSVTSRQGTMQTRKTNGRWGSCFGFSFDWGCEGSAFLQYSGSGLSPVGGKLTGSVDANVSKRFRWPTFPLLYAEGKLGGKGKLFLSYDGRKYDPEDWMSAFNVGADFVVPYGTLGVGIGKDGVADVNISGTIGMGCRFNRELQDLYLPVDIDAYLELFWAKYNYNIFSGTWELYPHFGERVSRGMPVRAASRAAVRDFRYPDPQPLPDSPVVDAETAVARNVVRLGSVRLAENGGKLQTVYLARNDARTAMPDRPCLHYKAYRSNGEDVSDEVVWEDGTGDFYPDLAVGTDGTPFVAWVNGRAPLGATAGLDSVMTNAEIAVAVKTGDSWQCRNLTQNDLYESAPSVAAANGTALVVWRRNDKPATFGSAESPDQVWFARYASGEWSEPEPVFTSSGILLGGDLAWNGTDGAYAYVADEDGDPETREDREVHIVKYANGSWGDPERITDDSVEDRAPTAWYEGGRLNLLWQNGERLLAKSGDADAVEICRQGVGAYDVALDRGEVRAVVFTGTVDGQASSNAEVYAVAYDRTTAQWEQPVQVSEADVRKDSVAGVVSGDGRLQLLYRAVGEDANYADLNRLDSGFAPDVAIVEDGISLSDGAVEPGSNLTVRVRVMNRGLASETGVSVSLGVVVDGSERSLGTSNVVKMVSGEVRDVEFNWVATVSTSDIVFRARTGDSSVSYVAFKPDLQVCTVSCVEGIGEDFLRAKVRNRGLVTVASGTKVAFRLGDAEGQLLGVDTLGEMPYGVDGSYEASIKWPGTVAMTASEQVVTVIVDPDGTVSEFDRDNNVRMAYVRSSLDTDGDGLTDAEEQALGTDIAAVDTDGDGFSDFDEHRVYCSCPTATSYSVTFDLGGLGQHAGGGALKQVVETAEQIRPPEVTATDRHVFVGWDIDLPQSLTASIALKAVYVPAPRTLDPGTASGSFEGAANFAGWVADQDGCIAGLVSAKVAKPGKKTPEAKATVTLTSLATGKKTKMSGVLKTGSLTSDGTDGLAGLTFSEAGISGSISFGDAGVCDLTAVRDPSSTKDEKMTTVLNAFAGKSYVIGMSSYGSEAEQAFARGYGTFTVSFAKKGKAKVAGFLPDGTKVSSSGQLLLTKDGCCLPVFYSKSGKTSFAFALWFKRTANLETMPITNMSAWKTALVEKGVKWLPNAALAYETPRALPLRAFSADGSTAGEWLGQLVAFPSNVAITVSANLKKWDAGKAASLKLKDGVITGADDKAKPNLTGLKLTFTPKTGAFKGSFSAVSVSEAGSKPKLVKSKATVNGVLIDNIGYGSAVFKRIGSTSVTVDK